MPRQLRVEYPGAIYHLMSRGDRQKDIYVDDVGRPDFLRMLAEACQKTGFQVHACCLMGNHFHLVVETPNANLVAGMRWLLSTCTIRLNQFLGSGRIRTRAALSAGGRARNECPINSPSKWVRATS